MFVQIIKAQSFELVFEEQNGGLYKLSLPYNSPKKHSTVFVEDTPYALDILGIIVDGIPVELEWSGAVYEPYYYFDIRKVNRDETQFFIHMIWGKNSAGKLVWNDKRGGNFSYVIEERNKELRIRYRVLFPFPFVTLRKLMRKRVPEWAYSPEFEVTVNW